MSDPVVYVVDDDPPVRESLRLLIRSVHMEVECFPDAVAFLAGFDPQRTACLVLDIRMPTMSGLELQLELNRRSVRLPIIFLTGHGDVQMAVQAMHAGAWDFVEKPFRDQSLIDSINAALNAACERRANDAEIETIRHHIEALTPREKDVMQRIVDGQPNKVIAAEIGLSERTVEIHRSKVMSKMQVRSLAALVKQILAATQTSN